MFTTKLDGKWYESKDTLTWSLSEDQTERPAPEPEAADEEQFTPMQQAAEDALMSMTSEQRMDVFRLFCRYCGDDNPRCYCSNDD